ncbi:FG-GAP-like repeat-containing protein (plasmid) [Kovacikia minuta CCNUW1]|uniref:FG-GAP-like repeat-containing protein n=1 Tax=Kovacikia minuta TaxID=2931930 RepID=UPI001CCAD344|nr:FG-GAP-like repeat-containing protein [Kovacikia minuta]UBF30106.1 FG-GAP-like repeat-containing protein [Kovacikia minuta CCNUW1]
MSVRNDTVILLRTMKTFMLPEPGDTLSAATSLNLKTTNQPFQDVVSLTDDDYYRFRLEGRSSFNLSLTGLDGNADVQLLDHTGAVVQQSVNTGNLSENINLASLDAGIYYLRVFLGSGSSSANYTLGVQAQSSEQTNIVWRNYSSGQNEIWEMNGVSLDSVASTTVSNQNFKIEGIGDFNGDGSSDLLWHNASSGQVVIWLMNGITYSTAISLGTVSGADWKIAATDDFNGDGQSDILWRNTSTGNSNSGRTVLWQMNGGR